MTRSLRSSVGSVVASWIETEEAELRAHPRRWYWLLAAGIALAFLFPFITEFWPLASGVCVLWLIPRLAVLVHLRVSGKAAQTRALTDPVK